MDSSEIIEDEFRKKIINELRNVSYVSMPNLFTIIRTHNGQATVEKKMIELLLINKMEMGEALIWLDNYFSTNYNFE